MLRLKVLDEGAPPRFDISEKFVDITVRLTSDWADDLKCRYYTKISDKCNHAATN